METFSFLAGSLPLENRPFHFQIADQIKRTFSAFHGYVGYKLTTLGRASDDDVPSFLILTKEHGIILVDIIEEKITGSLDKDGSEYWLLDNKQRFLSRSVMLDIYEDEVQSRLKNEPTLYNRKTKKAKTPVHCSVVFCSNNESEIVKLVNEDDFESVKPLCIDDLNDWLTSIPATYNCSESELDKLYALIEGTFIYESKSQEIEEESLKTVNDYIEKSLKTTFKQDEAQRVVSMQLPPGPQRIRGLAGTGKTIVLCLKAAITHKKFKDFKILYLFNTQSLYQHVQNLIAKYYTLEAKRAPDFEDHLHVLHAWGGKQKPGLYFNLCKKLGLTPLTLADTRGKPDGLAHIYKDLLSKAERSIEPEYDLILIDEAQDFPPEVFQVVFKLAKGQGLNKRIIWAYDEFQSLREAEIKGPAELFGADREGHPNIPDSALAGVYPGDIPKDFVLPNCYRTPRPVLMTAHGIAMGLYTNQPSEMFFHPAEWRAIGYEVNQPHSLIISAGDQVEIERTDKNSRNLLESLLRENHKRPLNLVQCSAESSNEDQLKFVCNKMAKLINEDGVSPEEIIVVNLRSGNNKEAMLAVQKSLNSKGIKSVIPGYVESADVFKPKGYVTITTPFRAKGNEANIVFVINSQVVPNDFTLRMRNAFFVAVTRSRGWCYICGYGDGMQKLEKEIDAIKSDFPKFKFVCPEKSSVQRSKKYLLKSDKELDKIQELIELIDKNPDLLEILSRRSNHGEKDE